MAKMYACKSKEARMRISSKTSRPEFWRQVLERQRRSGLSVHRFCQQEALATATFYAWQRRLGRGTKAASVGFAPVRVESEGAPAGPTGVIEIVLPHDRRVRLSGKVDRQQLADVLAVLDWEGGSR
jgi:hypothetical protein